MRPASINGRRLLSSLILVTTPFPVLAKWEVESGLASYYTDHIGLFSVSRRLSLEDDPTQPVIDEPERGSDFVYEPSTQLQYENDNGLGQYRLGFNAAAYVFQQAQKYTHSFFELQFEQQLSTATTIKLFYDFIPDLFLGTKRAYHRHIEDFKADENVDGHIASLHIDQQLNDALTLRSLSRIGLRNYNQAFEHRDQQFFTLGLHAIWQVNDKVEFLIGYHYEHGYAKGKQTRSFYDDVSYINHYTSAELKIEFASSWTLMLIGDYEHNDLQSQYPADIHYHGQENVIQGELEILHNLSEQLTLKSGWQNGYRRYNFEPTGLRNNNLWLGLEYRF